MGEKTLMERAGHNCRTAIDMYKKDKGIKKTTPAIRLDIGCEMLKDSHYVKNKEGFIIQFINGREDEFFFFAGTTQEEIEMMENTQENFQAIKNFVKERLAGKKMSRPQLDEFAERHKLWPEWVRASYEEVNPKNKPETIRKELEKIQERQHVRITEGRR